jgi:hypothetical protein
VDGFQNEIAICYSPSFKRQTAYGTALAQAELTMQVRAMANGKDPFQLLPTYKVIPDCTDQFVERRRTLRVYGTMTFRIEVTPQVLGGWLYFFYGTDTVTGTDPKAHDLKLMTGRLIPVTSIRVGHSGTDDPDTGWIYKDVAVLSIEVSAATGQDQTVVATITLVMSADRAAASGTTWPACYTGTPALLSDGDFTLDDGDGAESFIDLLRSISCSFGNRPGTNDDAWLGSSIHPQRWRRSAARDYAMSFALEGIDSPSDDVAILAAANDFVGTEAEAVWTIGSGNDKLEIIIPVADIGQTGGAIQGYAGELQAGVLNLAAVAKRDASIAASPIHTVATIPSAQQGAAFGVAA